MIIYVVQKYGIKIKPCLTKNEITFAAVNKSSTELFPRICFLSDELFRGNIILGDWFLEKSTDALKKLAFEIWVP